MSLSRLTLAALLDRGAYDGHVSGAVKARRRAANRRARTARRRNR